jgi:hypothetical protein
MCAGAAIDCPLPVGPGRAICSGNYSADMTLVHDLRNAFGDTMAQLNERAGVNGGWRGDGILPALLHVSWFAPALRRITSRSRICHVANS